MSDDALRAPQTLIALGSFVRVHYGVLKKKKKQIDSHTPCCMIWGGEKNAASKVHFNLLRWLK